FSKNTFRTVLPRSGRSFESSPARSSRNVRARVRSETASSRVIPSIPSKWRGELMRTWAVLLPRAAGSREDFLGERRSRLQGESVQVLAVAFATFDDPEPPRSTAGTLSAARLPRCVGLEPGQTVTQVPAPD